MADHPGARRRGARNAIRLLGLVVGSLVVSLLLAEVATRLLSPIQPSIRVRDPQIGNRYQRGFSGVLHVAESGQDVELRFNSDGFRGPSRPRAKPPGTVRIAIVGDSQIAAIATAEENTLVARLEALLAEASPEVEWEVFNFGVSGASPGQELVLYRELVREYDPDVVVVALYEGNDFSDNSHELSSNQRIYLELVGDELTTRPFAPRGGGFTRWLNENSRFYVWQKKQVGQMTRNLSDAATFRGPAGGLLAFSTADRPDLDRAWRLLERTLVAFRDEVETDGAVFVLLEIPDGSRFYPDVWARRTAALPGLDPLHATRRLEAIVARHSIDTLSLTDGFADAIGGRPSDDEDAWLYYGATSHLNVPGNALAAEELFRHLQRLGIVGQRAAASG